MSPPIRDGSGNSIGSIRLGDGSEISEVRTGAGDVLFSGITATQIQRSVDNDSGTSSSYVGVFVDPNQSISGIKAEISANTTGMEAACLFDSQGTQLDTVSASGSTFSPGTDVSLSVSGSLTVGEDHALVGYAAGNSWTHGRLNSPSFPYSGAAFDVPQSAVFSSPTNQSAGGGFFFSFNNIRTLNF